MNILVTGGAGFIGHQLIPFLLEEPNSHVTVVDNFSFGDRSYLKSLSNLEILQIDLRDRKAVFDSLKNRLFDAVYHLAAIHFIPYCNQHPAEALETNIWGTKNIFDALKTCSDLEILINISSAAVYEVDEKKHKEADVISPLDVYGRSKAVGEDLAKLFALETRVPTVSVRLFNVVGKNETNDHVLPSILKQLSEGNDLIRVGNLFPKRSYIDVRDVCSALRQFLIQTPKPGYYLANLGSEDEYSVQDILNMISKILKRPVSVVGETERIRKVERPFLRPSLGALKELIDWKPQYHLKQTLRELLEEAGLVKCESLL